MRFLDAPGLEPAEELAWEESRLESLNSGDTGESLRFWETEYPCVVVGLANRVEGEVNTAACKEASIPIFRRVSGGGTVLQGPGCLNYSLTLRIVEGGPLDSVNGANELILNRIRAALGSIIQERVELCGHTDLAIGGRKFSGNAQKRKRNALLFHGTLLLPDFNLDSIGQILRTPPMQPDYREGRTHSDFVRSFPTQRDEAVQALRKAWGAKDADDSAPNEAIAQLVREKYSQDDWNLRR